LAQKLLGFERPRKLFLTTRPFVDMDLLTPTMKLKRNVARDIFREQIAIMYTKK